MTSTCSLDIIMEEEDSEVKLKKVEREIQVISKTIQDLQGKKARLVALKEKLQHKIQQEKCDLLAQKDWSGTEYSWSKELKEKLWSVFKIKEFRPHQLSTMNATLSGTDAILIMPTGGGKSLCYQLPALVSKGITLVVSPLISLMEDQLMGLKSLNVDARMLSASSTKEEVNMVHTAMTDNNAKLKLLYVTPEKLAKSKRFMTKLQKMHQMGRFARLAIDEVHCCSQWGHDFRPDYKFLGIMRQMFPGTPILGLTATATSRIVQDVQKILNLKDCLILKASFNRPNLFYEVRSKPANQTECVDNLAQLLEKDFKGQSGIIYTMTIKDTEELTKELRGREIRVAPYHANLEVSVRTKVHSKWISNEYQAVVATIAFGMGIDKPDVRFVIHHCISKSMENFYQESGRAGRDGKEARCILYWKFSDLARQSTMVFTEQTGLENLYGIISYCIDDSRCRRNMIADHFDERWESGDCKGMCDHCRRPFIVKSSDCITYGEQILNIITKAISMDQKLTGQKLVDLWLGKGPANLRVQDSILKGIPRERVEAIVAHLLVDGFLKEDFHFTPYNTISYVQQGPKAEAGIAPSPIMLSTGRRQNTHLIDNNAEDKETSKNGDVSAHTSLSSGQMKSKNDKKVNSGHKFGMSNVKESTSSKDLSKSSNKCSSSLALESSKREKAKDKDLSSGIKRKPIDVERSPSENNSPSVSSNKRTRIITIDDSDDSSDY